MLSLADKMPLEAFTFVASFVEEVFAPVPSMAVLLLTGSFAALQDRPVLALIPLAIIAASGKTIGAMIVYFFSDKIGEAMVDRFGKFFGVTKESIHSLGQRLTGTPKDYLLLTILRALPIIPSSVMSIGCGILKIRFRLFLISTMIGTIFRDAIFIYIGYSGTEVFYSLITKSASLESLIQTVILVILVALFTYLYYRRGKREV